VKTKINHLKPIGINEGARAHHKLTDINDVNWNTFSVGIHIEERERESSYWIKNRKES